MDLVMYSEKGQVHVYTQPMENKPSSPPTPMLVGVMTESLDSTVVLVDPHTSSLSEIQLVLCERGRAVDGGDSHVNVSHPHDSPHTALVSLHVAVHSMRLHITQ